MNEIKLRKPDDKQYIDKAIGWVKKRAFISLKVAKKGYEQPRIYKGTSTNTKIQADLSYTIEGGVEHHVLVALKDENHKALVAKWKVLSYIASMKKGKLYLLTPKGHKGFVQTLVKKHSVKAEIHSI